MKFTPKFNVVPIACGILTIAAVGWHESVNRVGSVQTPTAVMQQAAVQESFPANNSVPIMPAVLIQSTGAQEATVQNSSAWYKNKHWWKKNAPIIGGAAGGGLIGGLAGGGKGLIIGGAAGAGGGYLYKHFKHHDHHDHYDHHHGTAYPSGKPAPREHGK